MIGAEIDYARDGWWVHGFCYGFNTQRIETEHGKKTILVPNKEEAFLMKKMFELRAKGYPDSQISQELNNLGFKTRYRIKRDQVTKKAIGKVGGEPLEPKIIQRLIKRPIFAGVLYEKFTDYQLIKANFEGLVDINTFNLANKGRIEIQDLGQNNYKIISRTTKGVEGLNKQARLIANPKFFYR